MRLSTTRKPVRLAAGLIGTALLAGAGLAGAGPAAAAPGPCAWQATALPTISARPNEDGNRVNGTDGDEMFAGMSADHAVLWKGGELVDLAPRAEALDVEHSGIAVGFRVDAGGAVQPVLWRGGRTVDLALPAGAGYGRATGINDAGLIVGYAGFYGAENGTAHAAAWSAGDPGTVTDLGVLGGKDPLNATYLYGVDQGGTFAGFTIQQETFANQGVTGTVATGLRELPGTAPGGYVEARGIAGRYAAGREYVPGQPTATPLLWVDGVPRPLPGDPEGWSAFAVNTRGTAVSEGGQVWRLGQDPDRLPGVTPDSQAYALTVTEDDVVGGYTSGVNEPNLPVLWNCR